MWRKRGGQSARELKHNAIVRRRKCNKQQRFKSDVYTLTRAHTPRAPTTQSLSQSIKSINTQHSNDYYRTLVRNYM